MYSFSQYSRAERELGQFPSDFFYAQPYLSSNLSYASKSKKYYGNDDKSLVYQNSIDQLVQEQEVHFSKENGRLWYKPRDYLKGLYLQNLQKKPEYHHIAAGDFLRSDRPLTAWIAGLSEELKAHVVDAFKAVTEKEFPFEKIQVHVLDDKEFRKAHEQFDGVWDKGIRGFSVNRQGKGTDHIFIRNDFLDAMMLTIGHEIGHLMSHTLANSRDEEAKAFAFSMAWMTAIVENNIAGLKQNINPRPARNGLHDAAFDFVHRFINQGMLALDIFKQLIAGELSFNKQLETSSIITS